MKSAAGMKNCRLPSLEQLMGIMVGERMKCNKTVLAQDSFNGLLLTKTMIHFVIWDFISAIRFEIDTTGSSFRDSSKNIEAIYAMKVTGQSVNM